MYRPRYRIPPRCAAPGSDRADAGGSRSRAAPCSLSVPLTCDITADPVMQSLRSTSCPAVACVTPTAYPSDIQDYGTSHGGQRTRPGSVPTNTEAAAALTLGEPAGFLKARPVAEALSATCAERSVFCAAPIKKPGAQTALGQKRRSAPMLHWAGLLGCRRAGGRHDQILIRLSGRAGLNRGSPLGYGDHSIDRG